MSTDIGGTDDDDFQSMVHLLIYADRLELAGLISSPYGAGRRTHILDVIDRYERDFANLRTYSADYPTPDALRAITKEGALETPGSAGFGPATAGSDWIVQRARDADPRPLWVLVWGGIEDVAQALHDAPDIESRLRVYFIGGPNKKWSVDAYQYIVTHHPRLWLIEANATYRGWFSGGNQTGEWGNAEFVARHVKGHGALGDYFASFLDGSIKMGDSPSVAYLLNNELDEPWTPGWGGRFVRAWTRPYKVFQALTAASDQIEQFGVFELRLALTAKTPERPRATMIIENQALEGDIDPSGAMRFRFSPKDAKQYHFTIRSNVSELDGKTGQLTAFRPPADAEPSPDLPNWWTDDPKSEAAEGASIGARSVSRWRKEFLLDFAGRMLRCDAKASNAESIRR